MVSVFDPLKPMVVVLCVITVLLIFWWASSPFIETTLSATENSKPESAPGSIWSFGRIVWAVVGIMFVALPLIWLFTKYGEKEYEVR